MPEPVPELEPPGQWRGVPRVARHRERLVRIGQADRELHGRGLAGDDRARRAQAGDHRRVALVAPGGIEDQALRRRRRIVGRDDVLDAQRDALQRARVDARGEVGVGLGGGLERRLVHALQVDAQLGVQPVGAFEHRPA